MLGLAYFFLSFFFFFFEEGAEITRNWATTHFLTFYDSLVGFPLCPLVKNLPANTGDLGSIPGLGRFPREGNDNPLQYSCLENSMDRGEFYKRPQLFKS